MNSFKHYLDKIGEIGFVETVVELIATVSGLPEVKPFELVIFENGQMGEVLFLHETWVEVLLLTPGQLAVGMKVTRTDEKLTIPVGESLIGCIVDPLGKRISGSSTGGSVVTRRTIDSPVLGIDKRASINKPLETGVAIVDMLIPLGKGQRELVIGDRKTGKTSFLLQTVYHQAKKGMVCIYAAIGRQQSEIKDIERYFIDLGVMDKVIIVSSSAQDLMGLIYLTPYSACAIAEYFRDKNIDTLVVLDDMSTHAKFYREICLLAKRFPGRDSYPVDIFFAHAKMLEKGGNFKMGDKETSITILPVVQSPGGELGGYIQTNLMSMTDGHIYFDAELFASGRRPAINQFLSVTRVGRQAQTPLVREVNREVLAFLTNYEKMQNFVHFGAELTAEVKLSLSKGEKITTFFEQDHTVSISTNLTVYIISLIWLDYWQALTLTQAKQEFKKIIDGYNTDPVFQDRTNKLVESSKNFQELLEKMQNVKTN